MSGEHEPHFEVAAAGNDTKSQVGFNGGDVFAGLQAEMISARMDSTLRPAFNTLEQGQFQQFADFYNNLNPQSQERVMLALDRAGIDVTKEANGELKLTIKRGNKSLLIPSGLESADPGIVSGIRDTIRDYLQRMARGHRSV